MCLRGHTADGIYLNYDNGSVGTVGGTSAAAPLWAAFTALINQQAAITSKPSVGFINPAIYALAAAQTTDRLFAIPSREITPGPIVPLNSMPSPVMTFAPDWARPMHKSHQRSGAAGIFYRNHQCRLGIAV